MWCKICLRETNEDMCSLGHAPAHTEEDTPLELYWCENCKAPIIKKPSDIDKDVCPVCNWTTLYLCADLRPVFPEERLLIEILQGKPLAYIKNSVWASNNRYYIDGKPIIITVKTYKKLSANIIREQLKQYTSQNHADYFNANIKKFVELNKVRLAFIIDESHTFIKQTTEGYPRESVVISFLGGKDSTVTADLTIKALGDPALVHIFGNTTLEFPLTIDYAHRYRKANPKAIFKTAINREQEFYKICEYIGPPARMLPKPRFL